MALLEIACFSAEHALIAFNSGADRIELCDNREAGGTTPSLKALMAVKQKVNIPIFVMVRPRGGGFNYTDPEFAQMQTDIDRFRSMADGFVFGILNDDSTVDVPRTTDLVRRAAPLPCTFHRAFDETLDPRQAFEDVITAGCHALLSSGGASSAVSGAAVLSELVQSAACRIAVIPGGGVRARNLLELHGLTRANVYHSSGVAAGREDPDPGEIRRMKQLLREHPVDQLGSIALKSDQTSRELQAEGGRLGSSHISAVSIGAGTPVDELSTALT